MKITIHCFVSSKQPASLFFLLSLPPPPPIWQFEGRKNVGRVVMGRSRLGVTLHSVITVAKHGKCLADGLSNVPVSKINEGLQNGHHIGTGTRAHVLYLAQTHPGPLTAEENRVGAWAPGRYFYGHYADSLWSSSDQAMDFKPYKEAKKYRYRAGLVADKERAAVSGRFTGRRRFCACPPCAPPKFATGKCLVRHISAPPVALVCPAVRAPAGTKTRTQALTDFSRALKAGEVRAVVAADDEKALEGNFWLAELLSESYAIDEDVVLNGDHLKAGFLVVKVGTGRASSCCLGSPDTARLVLFRTGTVALLPGEGLGPASVLGRRGVSCSDQRTRAYSPRQHGLQRLVPYPFCI